MSALLAAFVLAMGASAAAEHVHTVAAGESAGSLAKKYYGERDLGELLLRYNGKPGAMIHPGEKLTIPSCEVYKARPGDTWSGLAKRRLGRATAASVLAELSGYDGGQPLRVGARVVFPVVLRHTLARGETLSSLSEQFYRDPHKASRLQAFGRIGDAKRLAVGTPVEIPLVAFVRIGGNDVAKVKAAVAVPPADERQFGSPLAAAGRSFAEGDYDGACESLEALRERVLREGAVADRSEWGRLMAFVYIALDRDDDACTAYRSGGPAAGPAEFDPDLISPRIRAALSNCPRETSSLGRLDNPGTPPQIPLHAGTQR